MNELSTSSFTFVILVWYFDWRNDACCIWMTCIYSCLIYRIRYLHLDILFHQITTFIKVCVAFVFGLQILWLIDFTRIYQLKGLESKKQKQHELLWMLWIAKKHNLAFVYIGRQHFHQLCHSFIVCYNDFM